MVESEELESWNMRVELREDRSTIDTFPFGIRAGGRPISDELASRLHNNFSSALSELLTSSDAALNQTGAQRRDALYVVIPITVIYVAIFFTGLVGNVSTCVVIARNRSMHTATNYYLFSLAISDLLLLVSGLPPEMYYIWSHFPYVFGEAFCIIQSFAAETSANATVLTITAFTVERYVAICHPFLSHTMSKLSRAVKYVVLIWFFALCLAIPQAIQFGIVYTEDMNGTMITDTATCSVKWAIIDHAFEISTILFFVLPMTMITVLYILIGIKLRRSRILISVKRNAVPGSLNNVESGRSRGSSQRNVIRMLVAVVVAFFICWAPFHAQRLLAVYAKSVGKEPQSGLVTVYTILTYISGIFYYLSTTVNPLLYNIMSNKFREAFKSMLADHCGGRRSLQAASPRRQTYSSLSRYHKSTMRRPEQNSASFSASDETQRLTPLVRVEPVDRQPHQHQSPVTTKDPTNQKETPPVRLAEPTRPANDTDWKNGKTRSNHSSDSSQITLVTSLAKSLNEGCNNNGGLAHSAVTKCLGKSQRPLKAVSLGLLAERLRSGTKGLFANQARQPRPKIKLDNLPRVQQKIQHTPSIGSANTISNSSLQDLDETEFTGSELARYMGELNFDLVT